MEAFNLRRDEKRWKERKGEETEDKIEESKV